ncbi:MAG: hypothetical protein RL755_414 [Pseudomonadota bacterium]|jgi:uncharacterized protein (TIGR02246 family)
MKKMMPIILLSAIPLCSTYAQNFTPIHAETHNSFTCIKTNEEDIAALFDRWNAALATLDPNEVTAQYAQDAVLLATLSDKPRSNHEEIKDYFVHFLQKKPQGKIDRRMISIGCNTASDTGIYTFTVHEKGKTKQVQARYSFVYEYDDDQWLIEHHHSSLMPEQFFKAAKHSK